MCIIIIKKETASMRGAMITVNPKRPTYSKLWTPLIDSRAASQSFVPDESSTAARPNSRGTSPPPWSLIEGTLCKMKPILLETLSGKNFSQTCFWGQLCPAFNEIGIPWWNKWLNTLFMWLRLHVCDERKHPGCLPLDRSRTMICVRCCRTYEPSQAAWISTSN
jgi:hypothetical protein